MEQGINNSRIFLSTASTRALHSKLKLRNVSFTRFFVFMDYRYYFGLTHILTPVLSPAWHHTQYSWQPRAQL